MTTALADKQIDVFYWEMFVSVLIISVASPFLSYSHYCKSHLALAWREFLTHQTLIQYFKYRNYYKIQYLYGIKEEERDKHRSQHAATATADSAVKHKQNGGKQDKTDSGEKKQEHTSERLYLDNPDQRICDDIRTFTRASLTFINELLDEILQICAYAMILFSISPTLVIGLVVYAVGGTYLAAGLFAPLLNYLNAFQSKLEANFRFALIRIRGHSEAIAFYSGEQVEIKYLEKKYHAITDNLIKLAIAQKE